MFYSIQLPGGVFRMPMDRLKKHDPPTKIVEFWIQELENHGLKSLKKHDPPTKIVEIMVHELENHGPKSLKKTRPSNENYRI